MKTMAKKITVVILAAIFIIWPASQIWSLGELVPLPEEYRIIPPDPKLPPSIIAFSKKWGGVWRGGGNEIESILIVEYIDGQKAVVIYGWSALKRTAAGWLIYSAKVKFGPKPKLEFGGNGLNAPGFIFEMQNDLKSIVGRMEYKTSHNIIVMAPIP